MSTLKVFRHEYKYNISYEEMLRLREKLNDLLEIEDFKYIEIPYYIDLNILKNLNKKNKALILLNSPC